MLLLWLMPAACCKVLCCHGVAPHQLSGAGAGLTCPGLLSQGLSQCMTVTAPVLAQDMGGKSPFEALLIYVTPLAPDRTRLVRTPVSQCLPFSALLANVVPTFNTCMADSCARRCLPSCGFVRLP